MIELPKFQNWQWHYFLLPLWIDKKPVGSSKYRQPWGGKEVACFWPVTCQVLCPSELRIQKSRHIPVTNQHPPTLWMHAVLSGSLLHALSRAPFVSFSKPFCCHFPRKHESYILDLKISLVAAPNTHQCWMKEYLRRKLRRMSKYNFLLLYSPALITCCSLGCYILHFQSYKRIRRPRQ